MTISIGSILVGIALGIVVLAYLARPFRSTQSVDLDRATEIWVARARSTRQLPLEETGPPSPSDDEPVNFCSKCGRRVGPEDQFCPGCGKSLRGGV